MLFHHGRCSHASGPNQSGDRRIGVAFRYVTPKVRQSSEGADCAMLVRGRYAERGWISVADASQVFQPHDLALYDEALAHQSTTLSEGAMEQVAQYDREGPSV
jgi:hypothetical protein